MSASCRRLQAQVCDHQALLPLLPLGYFIHSVNSGHTMDQALRITISQQRAPCLLEQPKVGVLEQAARLGCSLQSLCAGGKAGVQAGWGGFGHKQRSLKIW